MNFLRQGRVLIPPFRLLISWWWMRFGDRALSLESIPEIEAERLTLLIALLGAAALPVGFIIGGVSFLLLRTLSWISRRRDWNFDVRMSEPAWEVLERRYRMRLRTPAELFCAGTSYYLEVKPSVQAWIDRRWNAFYTYVNCVMVEFGIIIWGIVAFQPAFYSLRVWIPAAFIAVMVILAWATWSEVMQMIDFQARHSEPDGRNGESD